MPRRYPRFQQDFSGPSRTQTHFTDEVNVNNIVERYDATGIDPYAERKAAEQYGDGQYRDFVDAMYAVAETTTAFNELPPHAREQFQNDPKRWLEAVIAHGQQKPKEALTEPLTASDAEPEKPSTPVEKDAD